MTILSEISELTAKPGKSNKSGDNPRSDLKYSKGLPNLLLLRDRLRSENEEKLLAKISLCQEPMVLRCEQCEGTKKIVQWCRKKWCPCCAQRLAAQRSAELKFIVERFRFPLFVTLTMRNVPDLSRGGVSDLMKAFGKLRHRKLWKRNVTAGIAAVEVTNIGNGWHPHLHSVVDCFWLADQTTPPARGSWGKPLQEKCRLAAIEIEAVWSKCLDQETSSIFVKRCDRSTISKEVLKYTVKSDDLLDFPEPIGDMIRAIDGVRSLRTFGHAHGQKVKEIRLLAANEAKRKREEERTEEPERCDCGEGWWQVDKGLTICEQSDARTKRRLSCATA